jgi:hypothetical protein
MGKALTDPWDCLLCAPFCPPLQRRLRQAVGFDVIFAGNVGDGEFQGASQFAAGPMKGIETRTAAGIFAGHLANHDLGIGIDVQLVGIQCNRTLEGFHQGGVFGDVVVLVSNPLGDADGAILAAINDDTNAGRPGITQAAAIDIRHQIGHHSILRRPLQI